MIQTITFSEFTDAFRSMGRYDQFGYHGLKTLFNYLEEIEDSTGSSIELDVIALCCDFAIDHFEDIAQNYGIDLSDCDDDEKEQKVIDFLNEETIVCGVCADGIVYQQF